MCIRDLPYSAFAVCNWLKHFTIRVVGSMEGARLTCNCKKRKRRCNSTLAISWYAGSLAPSKQMSKRKTYIEGRY